MGDRTLCLFFYTPQIPFFTDSVSTGETELLVVRPSLPSSSETTGLQIGVLNSEEQAFHLFSLFRIVMLTQGFFIDHHSLNTCRLWHVLVKESRLVGEKKTLHLFVTTKP